MANLLEIAELSYRKIFPNPTIQSATKKAEFIARAKLEYAWSLWTISKETKREEGEWEIPSALFRRANLEVVDGEADISQLSIFRGFEGDTWIGNIGGLDCDCNYMRQSLNLSKILCDDDYHGDSKPYIVIGQTILFPQGTHKKKLPIIYATNGEDLEDNIEVDDIVGAIVANRLEQIYSTKQPVDTTVNSNPNQ